MTLKHLRELIAHHEAEASGYEDLARIHSQLFHNERMAETSRLKAEFHAATVVHLTELADAFASSFTSDQTLAPSQPLSTPSS